MTHLLTLAIEAVRSLSEAEQNEIAQQMLVYASGQAIEAIPAEDLEDVLAGLEEARRGDLASEDEVRATLARLG